MRVAVRSSGWTRSITRRPHEVVWVVPEKRLPRGVRPADPSFGIEDGEQRGREAEETIERLLRPPPLAHVAHDRKAQRCGLHVHTRDAHVNGHRRSLLADEVVALLRVEECRVAVRLDEPVEHLGRVGDDQVRQTKRHRLAAVEPGEPQGRRVEVDHAEVARVEDKQRVVRLAEQAAGNLELPCVIRVFHRDPRGWSGRAVGPIATRKPCVKWARSGGSGSRDAELVRETVS